MKRKPHSAMTPPPSPTRDPGVAVAKERFPPSPSGEINAINVNNSIDMGRKRSGSGSISAKKRGNSVLGSPSHDKKLGQFTPPASPNRTSASPSQSEVCPPPTGTTSSEELAVDKASTFNVEDRIPAASPRTAAANSTIKVDSPAVEKEEVDHDTDSTVTEDERDAISNSKMTPTRAKEEGEEAPLVPWDGDITSPEADAAIAREVIRGIEEKRKKSEQLQMDTGNHNETSDGLDEEMIQKALAKHKQVLASLESAKEEALRSYSDLVQLQSSLVRVSSSLSSPTSSSTSSTSRSAVPRVVQMMGAADVMINSYRESLRLSPSVANTGTNTPTYTVSHQGI